MDNIIMITGGCGFIGTSLVKRLLDKRRDIKILIFDNFITGTLQDLKEVTDFTLVTETDNLFRHTGVVVINGDIRNKNLAIKSSSGVDCIVHLAANTSVYESTGNPEYDMECNVIGTLNMLEAARVNNINKFIFASSGAPIGEVEPPIHEQVPTRPVSPYGASKLSGEAYCSAYYQTYNVKTICLRFSNVYGPRSDKKFSIVAKFIKKALNGEYCTIYGEGDQTRDFLFIDDLIDALLLCIEKNIEGGLFHIASGKGFKISELTEILFHSLLKKGVEMKINYSEPRLGDIKHSHACVKKAEDILGWTAKTKLNDGVEKTVNYFMKKSKLNIPYSI